MASGPRKIRYAVAGLGSIAQASVLPAFKNADNCELAALISNDETKLDELGKLYSVDRKFTYSQYDDCMNSGHVDAVYIALPNHMHREYTERAARAGVHVLCEKPMAVTEEDCDHMIRTCRGNNVKLMIAYRLHFEEGNLEAVRLATSGELGEVRLFTSTFAQQVPAGDTRVRRATGGGTLFDMGVYCINAARYIYRDEPDEVSCFTAANKDPRFREIEEMAACTLRFPGDRLATFICSFGASALDAYTIVGTKGSLHVEPSYHYATAIKHHLKIGEQEHVREFPHRDQFAPELIYFADCIQNNHEPEPSGVEGLADVRIVRALYRSAADERPVRLDSFEKRVRPQPDQSIHKPPVEPKQFVNARDPES
jgi:predicted dehydrogenase